MTAHASPRPFALDPLIAEARRRARFRRFGLVAVLVAALGLAFALRAPQPAPPGGGAATHYRLDWRTAVRVHGRVALRTTVYWINVSPSHWTVKASVVNASGQTLLPLPYSGWGLEAVSTAQRARSTQCTARSCVASRASTFWPNLPWSLAPGARWTGEFSGRGGIPRGFWASPDLGYYNGSGRFGFGVGPTRRAVYVR